MNNIIMSRSNKGIRGIINDNRTGGASTSEVRPPSSQSIYGGNVNASLGSGLPNLNN